MVENSGLATPKLQNNLLSRKFHLLVYVNDAYPMKKENLLLPCSRGEILTATSRRTVVSLLKREGA